MGTLFRNNSFASSLMTNYARIVGREYLSHILKPLVSQVMATTQSTEVCNCQGKHSNFTQIDPSKASPGDDPFENSVVLLKLCKVALQSIQDSLSICPM